MKKKKIILTGGTGFILSHVAEKYSSKEFDILILDNIPLSKLPSYMSKIMNSSNTTYVEADIRDKAAVDEAMKGADIVYHFAALMGTSSRFRQEVITTEVNVIGTLHACEAALNNNVKFFIYPPRPMKTGWLTPYIISKTAATQMVQMYHETYGLPTVGLNISNIYGPRERAILEENPYKKGEGQKMMATFIECALLNKPLPVNGDGEQSSDFIFIDDVIDACMKATDKAAIGKIIEIGTGTKTSVIDVAKQIIKLTRSDSEIIFRPMRTGETKIHTQSDFSDAKKILNWTPKTNLTEGLRKTIPWYANQLGLSCPTM